MSEDLHEDVRCCQILKYVVKGFVTKNHKQVYRCYIKCQYIHYIEKVKVMNNVSGSVPVPKSKGPFW
jgi:hypothetical protein